LKARAAPARIAQWAALCRPSGLGGWRVPTRRVCNTSCHPATANCPGFGRGFFGLPRVSPLLSQPDSAGSPDRNLHHGSSWFQRRQHKLQHQFYPTREPAQRVGMFQWDSEIAGSALRPELKRRFDDSAKLSTSGGRLVAASRNGWKLAAVYAEAHTIVQAPVVKFIHTDAGECRSWSLGCNTAVAQAASEGRGSPCDSSCRRVRARLDACASGADGGRGGGGNRGTSLRRRLTRLGRLYPNSDSPKSTG
jgi:hypothetical protein